MESILFALDLIAVVVLCHLAAKKDDAEKTTDITQEIDNA